MKPYPVKAPYKKSSNKKPTKFVGKIRPSREFSSRLEHRNVRGKKGRGK